MVGRNVLFVLGDSGLTDLEWILPVIKEYEDAGYRTTAIVLPLPDAERHGFLIELLRNTATRTIEGIYALDPLLRLFAGLPSAWRRFGQKGGMRRRLASWLHRLLERIAVRRWRRTAYREALRRELRTARAVFLGHIGEPLFFPFDLILAVSKDEGVPLVGFPRATFFHLLLPDLAPFDLILVSTKEQEREYRSKLGMQAVSVGAPKLEPSWRRHLIGSYEQWPGFVRRDWTDRKIVLVILKNDNSPVWTGISFAQTTGNVLRQLAGPDRVLILKPHPRQNMSKLRELLEGFADVNYIIDHGPLSYWSSRADLIVSLFSGGVVDPLADGKVPFIYWPIDERYANTIDAGEVKYVRRDPSGNLRNQYDDFAVVINQEAIALADVDPAPYVERFNKTFQTIGSARRVREVCEAQRSVSVWEAV